MSSTTYLSFPSKLGSPKDDFDNNDATSLSSHSHTFIEQRSEESIEYPLLNIENNASEHYGLEEEVTSKLECQQCSKEDALVIFNRGNLASSHEISSRQDGRGKVSVPLFNSTSTSHTMS